MPDYDLRPIRDSLLVDAVAVLGVTDGAALFLLTAGIVGHTSKENVARSRFGSFDRSDCSFRRSFGPFCVRNQTPEPAIRRAPRGR